MGGKRKLVERNGEKVGRKSGHFVSPQIGKIRREKKRKETKQLLKRLICPYTNAVIPILPLKLTFGRNCVYHQSFRVVHIYIETKRQRATWFAVCSSANGTQILSLSLFSSIHICNIIIIFANFNLEYLYITV
ncbi:hypothetical protein L1049_018213 [Liquidambar formosana]|uniref:Uncharacterized protein n=1 Tax=Liquidambar formosana TaxID=63359 RepID=A0AAP0R9R6_LIQFO